MRSFLAAISHIYVIENWPFSGTYPLIYGNPMSFYMKIHYMQAYFKSPYLSHITRSICSLYVRCQFRDADADEPYQFFFKIFFWCAPFGYLYFIIFL